MKTCLKWDLEREIRNKENFSIKYKTWLDCNIFIPQNLFKKLALILQKRKI